MAGASRLADAQVGVGLNPADKAKLSPEELAVKQKESDAKFLPHWQVQELK